MKHNDYFYQMLIREKQALQQQLERELQAFSVDTVPFPIDAKGKAVAASDSVASASLIRSEDV